MYNDSSKALTSMTCHLHNLGHTQVPKRKRVDISVNCNEAKLRPLFW